jgi:hypothetical protein
MKPFEKRYRPERRKRIRRECWLVEDWRKAYKWISVQAGACIAAVASAYELFPNLHDYVSPSIFRWLMVIGGISVIVGRIKSQQPK